VEIATLIKAIEHGDRVAETTKDIDNGGG
ncbi:uncharacterized protein METZ01_LOCUS301430, partial [marine metagenome]